MSPIDSRMLAISSGDAVGPARTAAGSVGVDIWWTRFWTYIGTAAATGAVGSVIAWFDPATGAWQRDAESVA